MKWNKVDNRRHTGYKFVWFTADVWDGFWAGKWGGPIWPSDGMP